MPGNELEVLNHYKRKIEKNLENEEILIRSLGKLDGVRVNIALLQDTGIGRTVSLLKKQYADQEIGTKSRDLVMKWKDVVAAEEEEANGSEESEEDKEDGSRATGDEEPDTNGSENHIDNSENEDHKVANGHGETEVTQRNGNDEESDKEHHKKSKKHKKDKEREKDRKDKHRNDDDREKSKKKKSSHRDLSEEESEQIKTEIKSEYIKKETISHSSIKKERTNEDRLDKKDSTVKEEKRVKHSNEDKKDKHSSSREETRDKKDKHTKEKENKEKSREHKSSNGEHRSRHENGEHKSRHEKSNGESSKNSSSKHSESRDKEKDKERKNKSEKEVQEGKSHKDKHRDKERTKDDSDRKHSSSKSKDRPKSEAEESHDRSEKQRLKDKKRKSESAGMEGFDMFANMGGGDKKHKKRTREDSTEELADRPEDTYKPTSKQPRVDSTSDQAPPRTNGFSAAMDHKKFKLPTPPRIDPTHISGPSFIPDISPHYKPLPRAPPPPNNHGKTDEGVTLDALIASRGKRQMAVYSGNKRSGFRGDVPSLKDQCIQKLKDNVDDIYECGGLSFDVLEPILLQASAETLMQIELYNPYLMEDTGSIWEGYCKKEFRNKQRNAEDLESWREMYERCIREREEKLEQLKNKVSKNFNSRGEAKDSAARQTKMAFVDQVSKPPREVRAQQAKNGTALPVGHSFKPGAGNAKVGMRNSDPTRGSGSVMTSKKPKTAPMMAKVRRMMRR